MICFHIQTLIYNIFILFYEFEHLFCSRLMNVVDIGIPANMFLRYLCMDTSNISYELS